MSYDNLLSPITIKNVELRNRMVVPSMGTNLGNDDGSVSQRLIDYYRTRAAGGWGLVVVEGVEMLDVSIMTYASTEYMSPNGAMPNGFNQFATQKIREVVDVPVMAVGRITPAMGDEMLRTGKCDLIAIGRGSLAEPALPNKLAEGKIDEIAPCISCTQSCLGYILSDKIYASRLVNPVTGHEGEYDFTPVETPKNVLVVGAGPAGLVAAMTAARRGHKVTLAERSDTFGGQFRLAAVPPTKHDIAGAIRYYVTMCKKLGVSIQTGVEVDEAYLRTTAPDAIILATGSVPAMPPIPGIDNPTFLTVADVLDGQKLPGMKVLIAGGGMSGVETADYLAERFRSCTVVKMRADIALDEQYTPRVFLMKRLAEKGVVPITSTRITQFYDDGIDYEQDGQRLSARGFDNVILAMGTRAFDIYWVHNTSEAPKWTRALAEFFEGHDDVPMIGVSNHNLAEIKEANAILREHGLKLGAVQNHLSLINRSSIDSGILDWCKENGVIFFSYMVLEQGALSGKYDTRNPMPEGSARAATYNPVLDKLEVLNAKLAEVAKAHGVGMAQVPVAWAIAKATLPIVGVTKRRHVADAAAAATVELSDTEVAELEKLADTLGINAIRFWEKEMK